MFNSDHPYIRKVIGHFTLIEKKISGSVVAHRYWQDAKSDNIWGGGAKRFWLCRAQPKHDEGVGCQSLQLLSYVDLSLKVVNIDIYR